MTAVIRRSGRAVIVDDDGRVLLLHGPTQEGGARAAWYMPGGRLEGDETYAAATVRELTEELGLVGVELGPCVWIRHALRRVGDEVVATESHFHLVRTPAFMPDTTAIIGTESGVTFRWWTIDDLHAALGDCTFIPARLPQLVSDLLAGHVPKLPLDVSEASEPGADQTAPMGNEHDERPWGSYTVLDDQADHKVKRIVVAPGKRLSYQTHEHRAEHWFIVAGTGTVTLNGGLLDVAPGSAIDIPIGTPHRIENTGSTNLVFIEVQHGTYFGEDDIIRLDDDFGRVT